MLDQVRGGYRAARRLLTTLAGVREERLARDKFLVEYHEYQRMAAERGVAAPTDRDLYPCLSDRIATTPFEPHYTFHTAWACRELKRLSPVEHVDIGSYLRFCAMASAWVPMIHVDFRKPEIHLPGLTTMAGDILALPFDDDSLDSLSCMHVLEHIGLGRYGDPLDPLGDARAAAELERVLAPHGSLLLVVPVGRTRTNFNAHRVYSFEQVMSLFSGLRLIRCSLVPDDYSHGMVDSPSPELMNRQEWGCGCFVFAKQPT